MACEMEMSFVSGYLPIFSAKAHQGDLNYEQKFVQQIAESNKLVPPINVLVKGCFFQYIPISASKPRLSGAWCLDAVWRTLKMMKYGAYTPPSRLSSDQSSSRIDGLRNCFKNGWHIVGRYVTMCDLQECSEAA